MAHKANEANEPNKANGANQKKTKKRAMIKRNDIASKVMELMRLMRLMGPMRPMRLMGLIGLMGLMGSCSDDSQEHRGELQQLELAPYYNIYKEAEGGTRAEPITPSFDPANGYVPYANLSPQADIEQARIHVYLTSTNAIETEGNFTYRLTYYTAEEAANYNTDHQLQPGAADYKEAGDLKSSRWVSNVWLETSKPYYIYGFMPASAAKNAVLSTNPVSSGTYENKAVLRLNGLNAITPADVCAIVGVQESHETTPPAIEASGIQIGAFQYQSSATKDGKNYIYLLLDHLYTCLNLEYYVGQDYSRLRTIKLRKVEMDVEAFMYNVTVTIDGSYYQLEYTPVKKNGEPVNTSTDTTIPQTAKVFDRTQSSEGTTIPVRDPNDASKKGLRVPGYFSPKIGNNFTIRSTYDVYDKAGNLIRANQVAENAITAKDLGIVGTEHEHVAGKVHNLKLVVEPTYLYQLSDGDLDNPTIKVGVSS